MTAILLTYRDVKPLCPFTVDYVLRYIFSRDIPVRVIFRTARAAAILILKNIVIVNASQDSERLSLDDYRRLAEALKTPPMFTDVLPFIVKQDEVDLLLKLSEKERSIVELSRLLHLSQNTLGPRVKSLSVRGFIKKRIDGEVLYSTKSFRSIVARYLSEGRADALGKYAVALANYRMEEHVKRARNDPYPEGKVLPVPEAILEVPINYTVPGPVSVVLPRETAIDILEEAESFSLRDCECRMTYKNCDKPLRVCLALNEFSDILVERGVAEKVSLEEAKKVLQIAHEHGLVHQVLYTDWLKGEVFDICSCCPCCCTYLRALLNHGVKHHIAKSGLVAKVDSDKCIGCGVCVERCIFHARKLENGKSFVIEENCYGCGLCTTTCPTGASKLVSASS
jgi:NAD-dependent dihydropyrimidine dehydrogenase PreA subunit/DNA-binding MarR family transcriptional regulator